MPIDYGVFSQLKPPPPIDTPDEVAVRQARAAEAQALIQERVQQARQRKQAQDDADQIQNTLIQANGDYDVAHQHLSTINPRAAAALEKGWTANQEATAKAATEHIKSMDAQTAWEAHLIQGITPENASVVLPDVAKVNPQLAARIAPNGQFDPKLAEALVAQADETKDRLNRVAKAHEYVTKDPVSFVATMIDASPDKSPQSIAATLQSMEKDYGVSPSVTASFRQGTPEQITEQAHKLALPAGKVEELAGQAEGRQITREDAAARLAQTVSNDAALRNEAAQRIALEKQSIGIAGAHLGIAQDELKLKQQAATGADAQVLKPGTPNYRQAQDLADGTLTFQDFQRLHSRAQADAPLRAAIYDTARQLNPNFNPSAFEIGYKFASNPKVRQQISSLKNVEMGVDDLLKFSDKASRSGIPVLNKALQLGGVNLGGKSYSNFQTAVTAFADELSGALGYGSATDMSREMGFKMTDLSQSPETFRSNIETVVLPFVARKKASIVGEMGPYAGGANPTSGAGSTKPTAADLIKKYGG